jgi:glutamine amidotransferase
MIAIVDYGMGNLMSVEKAFTYLGLNAKIVSKESEIKRAKGVVLPGVGNFGQAVANIKSRGLWQAIKDALAEKPFLGICLGMQLLFEGSEESPESTGFSMFPGRFTLFKGDIKVPHIGWNSVRFIKNSPITSGLDGEEFFYFVHSYKLQFLSAYTPFTLGVSEYQEMFIAAVESDNVFGFQFHPEKSGKKGLKILENFGRIVYGNICGY